MKSTRILIAVTAAAALTLSACGSSSDGSPTAAEQPSDSVAADADEDATDPDDAAADDATDDVPTDEAPDGDIAADDPADDGAIVVDGDLDAQSAAWFTTFCGISEPFDNFFGSLMGAAMIGMGGDDVSSADLTTLRDQMSASFTDLGNAMSDTAAELANTPPPGLDQGEQMATAAITGFNEAGPYLAGIGEQVSNLPTTDAETFSAGMEELMESVQDLGGAFAGDGFQLSDEIKAEINTLPACAGSMLFSDSF